jgi:hypothetical protein
MSAAEPEPASDAPRPGQVGMVMLVGGALLNTAYLVVGNDYSVFMDASWFPWMTETWRAVVWPRAVSEAVERGGPPYPLAG